MTPDQARLIEEHGPRVRRILIAWARSVPQHCQEDAIADGMVGLVKATETYKPDRGSFASYAVTRAIGEAIDGLRRLDHLSRSERRRHNRGDIEASDAPPLSIEIGSQHPSGDDAPLSETLTEPSPGPADHAEQRDRNEQLERAIEKLPPREQLVIRLYHFEERPMGEIAEELGITESRVSQLRHSAFDRMRPHLRDAA